MIHLLRCCLVLLLVLTAASGQSAAQLKNELKTKETAAKKDPQKLYEVGVWAKEKALAVDAKRLFEAVLKIKPDHPGANEALGNVLVEGKWLAAKEADALRKKALAAEYTAKGFVEVAGVWVEKDKADDAKRGVFWHDGEVVAKEELVALQTGKVRHPVTGELIDAKNLEKAQGDYFPIGGDRWGDRKEADTFHSDGRRPWLVRTKRGLFVSTLPLAKIEELKGLIDAAVEKVQPVVGDRVTAAALRPVVLVAATESEYRELGQSAGDGTDACGAFLMNEQAALKLPLLGDVRAAICFNHKDWGARYIRHCAALASAHGAAADGGNELPLWLLHGIGSLTSRFDSDHDAAWFGKQHVQKGGVRNLKAFFAGFEISGDMEPKDIDYNLFQSGLLLSYCLHGGDAKATAALQDVTAALKSGGKGGLDKAVSKLQNQLVDDEAKVAAYLQQVVAKGG
ncbi:MAG: hypothetical protein ACK5AL_06050 [Planctomycetota bacterium]|jgi:hypothetical protein